MSKKWEVQQAFPIDKYPVKDGVYFWLTEKLNGVRATLYNGELISRTGKPFTGLEHITSSLKWANDLGFVLDGELTLSSKIGMNDNEAFRTATGIINSDSMYKQEIHYNIFDMIPVADFESDTPISSYKVRRDTMELYKTSLETQNSSVVPVLYQGRDRRIIDDMLDKAVSLDKEGLMLNTDCPYFRKRHKGILKIKRFYTMDLLIVGFEEGHGRLRGKLGAFIVDYKGNKVRVGTGLTDDQRKDFWESKEDILTNKMYCEIKYKEISKNKNNEKDSLQFPIFVRLRDDKTEPSYG